VLDEPVEIVAIRATARRPLARSAPERFVFDEAGREDARTLAAHSFALGRRVPFTVIARSALASGATLAGPAIITEETATTYVDAGFEVTVDPTGVLALRDTDV
jgi:N-methylhydantoinase A